MDELRDMVMRELGKGEIIGIEINAESLDVTAAGDEDRVYVPTGLVDLRVSIERAPGGIDRLRARFPRHETGIKIR